MTEQVTVVASRDTEAKDRAASVVMIWREVDWDAVELGQPEAVAKLLSACEAHETTRRFLDEEAGEIGRKLTAGLERFYTSTVGPRLASPAVLTQLHRQPAASPDGAADDVPTEDGLLPRARPAVTVGHTVRMNTGCGHLYVTVNEGSDGRPFELFNHMGKAGGCAASQNEAIGRLISYALRCGAKLEPLIKQLKGISCHRPAWGEDGKISSCSDAIGKALEQYYVAAEARQAALKAATAAAPVAAENGAAANGERWNTEGAAAAETVEAEVAAPRASKKNHHGMEASRVQGACVDCGSQLSFEEGCVKCHSCGFTECG
ncbi:MAG: hypothetical protein DHS20C15_20690 [Planctomycetota bacterium]|nr:MAG: hypothetical protein DHS20C15_20690 [Planctomycetota bacterium]